jgi:hypothetical protein
MSFLRIFHWTCDKCATEEQKDDYGLPEGWTWGYTTRGVEQWCAKCSACWVIVGGSRRIKLLEPAKYL